MGLLSCAEVSFQSNAIDGLHDNRVHHGGEDRSSRGGTLRIADREPVASVSAVEVLGRYAGRVGSSTCNQSLGSGELMDVRSSESELRALMIAGLAGDAAAHKALLARLSGYLRAYFKRQLARINRGPAEAEDLVQEVLIAIHTRRHTYDSSRPFTPWVYAVARYKLMDHLRRTKASMTDVPLEDAEEVTAHDDRAGVESALDLERLLLRISPKTRRAIQYVKLDGLRVSEAAARSGMSESAVKVAVHRGLRALALLITKGAAHED
jgi:RNA polymerase sigma-70 factor, ECF subfamily